MNSLAGAGLAERRDVASADPPACGASNWREIGGPEVDLLLLAVRRPQREDDRRRILNVASGKLDWPLVLRLALHHRVAPLVSNSLNACLRRASLPEAEEALAELRRLAAANAQRSLVGLAELRRLSQAFEASGLSLRVLKGLPLSQSAFGDLSLRSAGDIDLLVDESSIAACGHELRRLGYQGDPDLRRYSQRRLAFYCRHWKDIVYSGSGSGFEIDLHWRCFRNRAMPGTNLCSTTESDTVSFGGFRVQTLPRLEGLLYLCVHGTLDGWLYLKALADVAAQVRTMSEAELDTLAEAAVRYAILPELTATLLLVRRYLAMDHWSSRLLPAGDATVRHIVGYADRVLVGGGFLTTRESIPISATLAFEFGLRRSFRYRLELLVRVLFRSRMWKTIPLPDFLFGLYPLLSPVEWLIFRLRQRRV